MNKLVASVGLVALGAASAQAQSTTPAQSAVLPSPAPKWWSVSATVRGFYDDNVNTAPNGAPKVNTWGYEVSPQISLNIGNHQTTFSASYTFDFLDYFRPITFFGGANGVSESGTRHDFNHTFTALLDHAFSERYAIHVTESFVVGQQPDILRAGNAVNVFQRIPGDNIVNSAGISLNGVLTPELGFEVGYNNNLYDYHADQLSGPLNRIENYAHVDLRWNVAHETVAILGYQFGDVIYTGSGPFANPFGIDNSPPIRGLASISIRNTISHTVYAGAEHTFLPNLTGAVRAGASYYDYYNDTGASDFGPYAQASLTYTYAPESSLGVGFQEGRIASSITSANASVIHDTETSVVYGSLIHRIVPRLFGSIKGTFQNSTYHGGGPGVDGQSDRFYEAEADLEYRFNSNFSVHGGYDYDKLGSSVSTAAVGNRDYDRNRFYFGATASY